MLGYLLQFIALTHRFQRIKRVIRATGEDRDENDAEHSFQLALVGWYLCQQRKLALDTNKVVKYALAHDLVEVHAGDTDAFTVDEVWKGSKASRELAAAEQLQKDFPDFIELHAAIHAYERREDEESKFVYALDKLLPPVNIYLDGGRSWRELHRTFEEVKNNRSEKLQSNAFVYDYLTQLLELMKQDEADLFGSVKP